MISNSIKILEEKTSERKKMLKKIVFCLKKLILGLMTRNRRIRNGKMKFTSDRMLRIDTLEKMKKKYAEDNSEGSES